MNTTDKRTLRKEIRAEIAKLSIEEKQSLSTQIFSKIATLSKLEDASVVALFVSLSDNEGLCQKSSNGFRKHCFFFGHANAILSI